MKKDNRPSVLTNPKERFDIDEQFMINNNYKNWISEIAIQFRQFQIKAATHVNSEMLGFYWNLGRDIALFVEKSSYGDKVISNISKDLRNLLPDVKSFSVTNLLYMKNFYITYNQIFTITPQLGEQSFDNENKTTPQLGEQCLDIQFEALFRIPWGHHKLIIDKCKGQPEEAFFYVKKTLENNWSRAVLLNFLSLNLYGRQGKAITNFKEKLPLAQGELAQEITKDPYSFDFLTLRERYDEKELKDALMDNISKFLLELGNGFAFVGREVRLMVGEKEKFLDMLFYNIKLHCYVVLEVKVKPFDSSFAGQLGTYVVAVNHQLKGENDTPTIGILVCKEMDKVEAQYALESSSQPIGISGYELSKLIPEKFKSSLPSIEEIEKSIND